MKVIKNSKYLKLLPQKFKASNQWTGVYSRHQGKAKPNPNLDPELQHGTLKITLLKTKLKLKEMIGIIRKFKSTVSI